MMGRSRELSSVLRTRRIDIACIQEIKWRGAKAREIGDGYKLYYNGEKNTQNGVGIVVSQKLKDSIVAVNRVSDRLMSLQIDSGAKALRVISCYAPQVGCSDKEKDDFWTKLEDYLLCVRPEEHLVMGGDLNGHVGTGRDGYEQQHGGKGYGTRNEEGCHILDFVEAHNLAVVNTFFKKRPTHLITYSSGG